MTSQRLREIEQLDELQDYDEAFDIIFELVDHIKKCWKDLEFWSDGEWCGDV